MLRSSNPASSMQKAYDEAYLTCSTAIYFEKQGNEDQALRSWREALDSIYYHNAYKIPANYRPKNETERALQESLRDMELQCKDRLDLLETLKKSRSEARSSRKGREGPTPNGSGSSRAPPPYPTGQFPNQPSAHNGFLGQGTIPPANYMDIARPKPPPRQNSHVSNSDATGNTSPVRNMPESSGAATLKPPDLKPPPKKTSRSPSPDKKSAMLKSTLRSDKKDGPKSRLGPTMRSRPGKSAAQAATIAWPGAGQSSATNPNPTNASNSSLATSNNTSGRESLEQNPPNGTFSAERKPSDGYVKPPSPSDFLPPPPRGQNPLNPLSPEGPRDPPASWPTNPEQPRSSSGKQPPPPPPHRSRRQPLSDPPNPPPTYDTLPMMPPPPPAFPTYRKEYPTPPPIDPRKAQSIARQNHGVPVQDEPEAQAEAPRRSPRPPVPRKSVPLKQTPTPNATQHERSQSSSSEVEQAAKSRRSKKELESPVAELPSSDLDSPENASAAWDARVKHLMSNLPKGVDEQAAKSIFNEVVVKGDEVHWDDVAGLDIAKNALKEAVVYPFLRPDLFMGLREPARGMLLFGPPGTGKTMLARAVATESRSTFFAISASSLTSKFLGESEKLVRALFSLAKALAPSIIFVDEIDSLLSSRSGNSEHEATRRIKTEFLIQWSDLAKAAAGREQTEKELAQGDASRVLVLAATNLPWAIDDAARRRFVRRQYIPLPEDHVRADQLRRLMSAQKHKLSDRDIDELVTLTDGFSGSDITALAKDAAMGPLRSLGEQLLSMSPDEIRPIMFQDFESSLVNIRPSVSKQGLKEFEDWAREFGERGG